MSASDNNTNNFKNNATSAFSTSNDSDYAVALGYDQDSGNAGDLDSRGSAEDHGKSWGREYEPNSGSA